MKFKNLIPLEWKDGFNCLVKTKFQDYNAVLQILVDKHKLDEKEKKMLVDLTFKQKSSRIKI